MVIDSSSTAAANAACVGPREHLLTLPFRHWLCLLVFLFVAESGASGATAIAIDGSQTYQSIDGFGVNANHRSWNNNELKPVLDAFIDQAGMTLFHVIFDNNNWEAINDNTDPEVMNWDYYNGVYSDPEFQKLWGIMAYLNQRGITNGLVPEFEGPVALWMGGLSLAPGYENEYAETIASLLVYARNTQHLHFSTVGPINEPDIEYTGIHLSGADQYVAVMHALAQQFDNNGLADMRFSGPDLANTSAAWLGAMMNDPLVMAKLAHFGLHSYLGTTPDAGGVYDFIQQSAYPDRHFWMTEFNVWCNSCAFGGGGDNSWDFARGTATVLLDHLANGAAGALAWEGYDSQLTDFNAATGGNNPVHWSYWGLFAVEDTDAVVRTYTPRKGFYTVAQISKFVRPGARRIAVSGASVPLTVLAFCNTNTGQVTITGVNADSSAVTLSGSMTNLPAVGALELYYTDRSHNLFHSATVPVTDGRFTAAVPADSVFTLVTTNVPPASTPTPNPTFSFGPPTTPVWDISGTYQLTNHMEGTKVRPLDVILRDVVLDADARGRLQGAGTIPVLFGADTVAGDYKVTGNLTGGGTKTRANITIKCKGQGTVAGAVTSYDLSVKYNLQVNPAGLSMLGKVTGTVHLGKGVSGSIKSDLSLPLPPGADGGWNVTLNVIPYGTKLSGTAVVLVDNTPDTTLATKVTGGLSKQSGAANVKLAGYGNSAGTQINLQYTPVSETAGGVATVKGKVLGQNVKN
jgi:O-glycosyl hydrolase